MVRTDKSEGKADLKAKSRMVLPGDVDPDGEKPLEDGGIRTDAPTSSQLAFHIFCSNAVRRQWRMKSFDVSTAFLHGDKQEREIYCRPPKDGLPGVHPDSLLRVNTGVYGLREAPRLWYLKASRVLKQCGWEELKTARSCYVLRDKKDNNKLIGMLLLYVDDACFGGEGPVYERVVKETLKQFTIGKTEEGAFKFLGRQVTQNKDFSVEIDMDAYFKTVKPVQIPMQRRKQGTSPLTSKELHDYRSLVGQLAWPARQAMPQLAYHVSDLQQKTQQATVTDLVHANHVLGFAKKWSEEGIRLKFLPLDQKYM